MKRNMDNLKIRKSTRLSLVLLLAVLMSCSEGFLEVENQNVLSESSFYKTEKDFEDLLITSYMPLGFAEGYAGSGHRINYAIDDRVLHERFNDSQLQYTATNGDIAKLYYSFFTGVFRCNLFLEKFTEDIEVDDARRKTMLGEAHFLRGLYYFYLATYYEVPPLLKETAKDPTVGYPNARQDDVYAFVESEFELAKGLLPQKWGEDNTGRATEGAARAFLGKTYLYQGKFDLAEGELKDLIDLNIYQLNLPKGTDSLDYIWSYLANFSAIDLPNENKVYDSEFNSESIFEISFSNAYDLGARASNFLPLRRSTGSIMTWNNGYANITGGFGNVAMEDKKFPDVFETLTDHPSGLVKDPRYYATFIEIGDTLDFRSDHPLNKQVFKVSDLYSPLGTKKGLRKQLYPFHTRHTFPNAPYQDPNNWRLMRYADVLLMYAEAAYRVTNNPNHTGALVAINSVRSRVGMPSLVVLSKEAIIHERDIELVAEHSRFWDLARWYKDGWMTIEEVRQFKPTFEEKHVCFPIPLSEINKHYGVLKQNPKWF